MKRAGSASRWGDVEGIAWEKCTSTTTYYSTVVSSTCWLQPLSFHLTDSAKWKNSVLLTSDCQ